MMMRDERECRDGKPKGDWREENPVGAGAVGEIGADGATG
jgi:hypothetical protein